MSDTYSLDDLRAAWLAGRDAASEAAATFCFVRSVEGSRLKYPAVFTSHTHQFIREAIRAMTPPDDLGRTNVGAGK